MSEDIYLQAGGSVLICVSGAETGAQNEKSLEVGEKVVVHAPAPEGEEDIPPWEDVREQLPLNPNPDNPGFAEVGRNGWWKRTLDQIDGITIHHTMTHNMMWLAGYCTRSKTQGGKGYPTTNYAFWVHADGTVSYCIDLTEAPWHDHCGDKNTHVAVGMAGDLSKAAPPVVQLEGLVKLVVYLMRKLDIPLENVEGHGEWAMRYPGKVATACPGWHTSGWRNQFYQMLRAELNPAGASFAAPTPDYSVMETVIAAHDEGR